MTTRFDYTTFFNYYTDARNVTHDVSLQIQFYHNGFNTGNTGNTTITIHGQKYYIKTKPRSGDMLHDSIMFTLPTTIPGYSGLWDFHYHFGMKKINSNNVSMKSKKKINVVYFHKTIQKPQISSKKQENCYFLPNQPIDTTTKIEAIDCLESKDSKMTRSTLIADLPVIQELIRRPFYGVQYGGDKRRKRTNRTNRTKKPHAKTRKIHK